MKKQITLPWFFSQVELTPKSEGLVQAGMWGAVGSRLYSIRAKRISALQGCRHVLFCFRCWFLGLFAFRCQSLRRVPKH